MRGRVAIGDGAIAGGGENAVVQHNQRSDGHLATQRGGLRLHDGQMHVFGIVHGCGGREEGGIKYSTSMTSCSPLFRRAWAEWRPTPRQPVARHSTNPS